MRPLLPAALRLPLLLCGFTLACGVPTQAPPPAAASAESDVSGVPKPIAALLHHSDSTDAATCTELDQIDRSGRTLAAINRGPERPEEAGVLMRQAIDKLEAGDTDAALALLQRADQIAPGDAHVRYETAYVYFVRKELGRVVTLLLEATPRYGPLGFQLLGNAFDVTGRTDCALKIYDEGLGRFPNFGGLYLDLGVAYARRENMPKAMYVWERGIREVPQHPSNYFQAARAFANTNQPIWGILYGEAFMILEPATDRTDLIGRLLFLVHTQGLEWLHPIGEPKPSLYQRFIDPPMSEDLPVGEPLPDDAPFEVRWSHAMAAALAAEIGEGTNPAPGNFDTDKLHRARKRFLKGWIEKAPSRPLEHPVLEYQARLLEADLFDIYDRWLFRAVVPGEVDPTKLPVDQVRVLASWMREHPLPVESGKSVARVEHGRPAAVTKGPKIPSMDETRRAIAAFEAAPLADASEESCRVIMKFTFESPAVMVIIADNVLPWMVGDTPQAPDLKRLHMLLFCAFMAGNVQAQLDAGERKDKPLAGLDSVFRVYRAIIAANPAQQIDAVERLMQAKAAGTLEDLLKRDPKEDQPEE